MKFEFAKKMITNFRLDYCICSTPNLKFFEKIVYLWNKYFCVFFNKREISYLGYKFYYDNRFSPALLETYPKEIADISRKIDLGKVRTVLDIGANIGQFAYTLKRFYPKIMIYSFEPNKEIYPILEKNLSHLQKTKIYNLGLGTKTGKRSFYFSASASAEGSFYKENMLQNYKRPDVKETKVEIISLSKKNLKNLSLPKEYDLAKIDVEGAEIEVLKALKEVTIKYLLIEVSVKRKGGSLEEVKKLIKNMWGVEPKLVYYNLPNKDSPAANAIFGLR